MNQLEKDKLNYIEKFKGVASVKQRLILLSVGFLLVLGGCGSKHEAKVFSTLNDHIASQNECNVNNQTLTELLSKETDIYNQIIEKGLDPFEAVASLIEEGKINVNQSKTYLTEYQSCILKARVDQITLEKENHSTKEESAKLDTEALLTQYVDYETSLMDYVDALLKLNEAQADFYHEVNATITMVRLDELVTAINLAIDEANATSVLHQQALAAFNTSYTKYYETYIK